MEIKEAEKYVGCLVQVSRTDYNFGGMVYLLASAWREVSMSGTHDYGVTLRDTTVNSTIETKADNIELIPYNYPNLKYKPEYSSPLTATEVMRLIGSVVSVDNSPVWLKRGYKTADEYRHMRFEADIQELVEPYIVRRVQLKEITRYIGEPPKLPTGQNEKPALIRH
ncbi:MAG: hypothetical protein Q4G33_14655 [bacterium]|nr:hypothetical protein [bacterium]